MKYKFSSKIDQINIKQIRGVSDINYDDCYHIGNKSAADNNIYFWCTSFWGRAHYVYTKLQNFG